MPSNLPVMNTVDVLDSVAREPTDQVSQKLLGSHQVLGIRYRLRRFGRSGHFPDRRLVGQKPSLYLTDWYDDHASRDWARPKSARQACAECFMMSGVKIVYNDQPSAALRMEYTSPRAAFSKDSAGTAPEERLQRILLSRCFGQDFVNDIEIALIFGYHANENRQLVQSSVTPILN
jgi:hypothetical protein